MKKSKIQFGDWFAAAVLVAVIVVVFLIALPSAHAQGRTCDETWKGHTHCTYDDGSYSDTDEMWKGTTQTTYSDGHTETCSEDWPNHTTCN